MTDASEEEMPPIKALIVGINKYIACDSLNFAVSDAQGINDTLAKVNGKIHAPSNFSAYS